MHASGDPGFAEFLERTHTEPIYVILGVQGSGTNMLGRILRRFFKFSLLRDGSQVFNIGAALGPSPSRDDVLRAVDDFLARAFPTSLRRKTGRIIADYAAFPGIAAELRPERIRSGADFVRLVHSYRAFSLGTTCMAVKSDDLWESIGAIDQVLPTRRTILITRDFRDNLLSISGKDFGPIEPLSAALYVKERLAHYAAEYRRAGPDALHVRFETLVTKPAEFIETFSQHFGLAPLVDPATATVKIRPNKTQKWKRLPAHELAWCEGLLYDELLEFGYTPESPERVLPGRAALLVATTRDKVKRVPQKLRRTITRLTR